MKFRKLFSVLGLGIFAAVSVGAGVALSAQGKAEPVKAEAPGTDVVQYFDLTEVSSWWFNEGGETHIYMFNSEGNKWNETVTSCGGQLYSFVLEAGYDKYIIARKEGGNDFKDQSTDIEYNAEQNFITFTGSKLDGYGTTWTVNQIYINKVDACDFYVDVQDPSYFWHNDGAKTYLYFYGAHGAHHYEGTFVGGNLYRVSVDATIYVERFLAVRSNGAWDGSSWDPEHVFNQSKDIHFALANNADRWVKIGDKEGGDGIDKDKFTCKGFESISVGAFEDAFAYYFLRLNLCLDEGGLHEDFVAEWAKASAAYSALKTEATACTFDLEAALVICPTSGDDNANHAMLRYDTILSKHSGEITGFISGRAALAPIRGVYGSSADVANNSNALIAIIAVIAIVSVSAVSVIVFIRKRKHN